MFVKKYVKRVLPVVLASAMAVSGLSACGKKSYTSISEKDFLNAYGQEIFNAHGKGEAIYLHGTNAGGYLLQEFWMTPTANSEKVNDQQAVIDVLTERFGEEKAFELIHAYEDNYWVEEDFKNIADMGLNCVRLPFWWRNLVDQEGKFYGYDSSADDPYKKAFEKMDWFVETAGKYGLYVILDFHGAPGSQNGSDHSGFDGGDQKMAASKFWFGKEAEQNKALFKDIWKVIATRYKSNPIIAGYDLMNEPFCSYRYDMPTSDDKLHEVLWGVYDDTYKTIREVDDDHMIIMEAVWDPTDLPNPEKYEWTNVMYEYHNYLYDDYDNAAGQQISNMEGKIAKIKAEGYKVPSYMGEFSYFNSTDAWDKGLELLTNSGISWTTWTYKTTGSNGNWGLYHHPMKMDNGLNLETASYDEIMECWTNTKTEKGTPNKSLIDVVKKWANQ